MANDFQNYVAIGRLGKDPETRHSASGTGVTKFPIAVSEKYNGEEKTLWLSCVAFGKLGEICQGYLTRGKQVCVSGKLSQNSWEDRDGNKRSTIELVLRDLQMLGGKGESGDKQQEAADDDIPF